MGRDSIRLDGGGGGPSAVPEPNTVNLLGFVALMGLALRRFRGFDKVAGRQTAY